MATRPNVSPATPAEVVSGDIFMFSAYVEGLNTRERAAAFSGAMDPRRNPCVDQFLRCMSPAHLEGARQLLQLMFSGLTPVVCVEAEEG